MGLLIWIYCPRVPIDHWKYAVFAYHAPCVVDPELTSSLTAHLIAEYPTCFP